MTRYIIQLEQKEYWARRLEAHMRHILRCGREIWRISTIASFELTEHIPSIDEIEKQLSYVEQEDSISKAIMSFEKASG